MISEFLPMDAAEFARYVELVRQALRGWEKKPTTAARARLIRALVFAGERLQAERRLGGIMAQRPKAPAGRPNKIGSQQDPI